MDEVDVAADVGAKHTVALQIGDCLEQLGWLAVGDGREQARPDSTPECGEPRHQRERTRIEPGVLGIDPTVRNGFGSVTVHFTIDADATQEDIEALVAQAQKRSAVYDLMANPTNIFVDVNC